MADTIYTFPGFTDVHVHFREPGMECAETLKSGVEAARAGGFSAVVVMPNTTPAGDSPEWIARQTAASTDRVKVFASASITKARAGAEVADLERLADAGAAFFTDDGAYVADMKVMEEAMRRAADLDMCVCQHAMDPAVLGRGVIRGCPLAAKFSLPVISPETETAAVARDISLCRVTGCRLHIQHISTAGGVELVREAQREGLPVTAEATPHHLLLCCEEIPCDDANYKMAPPLGNREDRAELRRAVKDGVLMFATDHAPHPAKTKNLGFASSANGIIGLESAVAITYAVMVEEEGMDVESWAEGWWKLPRYIVRGLSIPESPCAPDVLAATSVSVGAARAFDVSSLKSLSRNCPYDKMQWRCWPCR